MLASHQATLVVLFDRSSFSELRSLQREERFQALRSRSIQLKQGLVRWIDQHGLSASVTRISEPTAFNMLFIICTPDLADHLMDAPHVDRVFMNDDVPVELLQCNEESQSDVNTTRADRWSIRPVRSTSYRRRR